MDKHCVVTAPSEPLPPLPPLPPQGSIMFVTVLFFFFPTCSCEMMAESSVRPSAGGVARRRRERRLRSWWRHEQQTVRMALAAATHHSAQQNAAPREPKTGMVLLLATLRKQVAKSGKRVRLTKKTRPGIASHVNPDPDPGHSTPRRWKRLRPPFLPRSGGVRWACLAIFFLASGLGDFAPGDAWNLLSEGKGVGFFVRLVSPAEGVSALASVRLISCTRALR